LSGPKDKGEVNKKKYKQEKKETSYKKQKDVSDKKTNTQTVNIVPKSTMFLGCIRSKHPHGLLSL